MKTRLTAIFAVITIFSFFGGLMLWKANVTSGTTNQEQFYQEIRNGLAEINIPTENNLQAIGSATDNLSNFIFYRAGVQLSQANKDLLKQNEFNARQESKSINPTQLSEIITQVAFEKLADTNNEDINAMGDILKGYNAPDVPENLRPGDTVMLRANGEGTMTKTKFVSQVTDLKNNSDNKFYREAAYNRIFLEVERRVNLYSEAAPESFGDAKSNITPIQAVIIAYSVVSDDWLAHNQAGLQQKMQNYQQFFLQKTGQSPGNPQGQKAYGSNGYMYSSPVDLMLDNAAVTRFLTLVQERSASQ